MPGSTANITIIKIGPEDDLPELVAFEHETVEDMLRLFTSVRSAHCLRLIQTVTVAEVY